MYCTFRPSGEASRRSLLSSQSPKLHACYLKKHAWCHWPWTPNPWLHSLNILIAHSFYVVVLQHITPPNGRKCRDVFWLILYIMFMLGMGAIGIFSFIYGQASPPPPPPPPRRGHSGLTWMIYMQQP